MRGVHLTGTQYSVPSALAACSPVVDSSDSIGLQYACFNQNAQCIAVATNRGFLIFNCDPLKQTFKRDLFQIPEDEEKGKSLGSISLVEMLYTCNILAIVGKGGSDMWREDVCLLWDDRLGKPIVQVKFSQPIKNVQMLREAMVVILESKIRIYQLKGLVLIDAIQTAPNPLGLGVVISVPSNKIDGTDGFCFMLVAPALQKGSIQIRVYRSTEQPNVSDSDLASMPCNTDSDKEVKSRGAHLVRSATIGAHENDLGSICLSDDGELVATASTRGTLIRIFSTSTGELLKELRRGVSPASITCLRISPQRDLLAVCSSTGTLHLYYIGDASLKPSTNSSESRSPSNDINIDTMGSESTTSISESYRKSGENVKSSWQILGKISPYFLSEWSFSQFKFLNPEGCAAVCAFGPTPGSLFALTSDGSFYKLHYNSVQGGPIIREAFYKLAPDESL